MTDMKQNRLAGESSPYLLQHADNPVDWYPWGEAALSKAHDENKIILLSIGYSACHWCHVMAHESFEDEDTARVMNKLFVNIKIDREERPDIDKIYQTAYQLLNRRAGGWPLTVFLTPDDHVPFFAATYLPKTPRYGMPAFVDLMRRISAFYEQNEADIRRQNDKLMQYLNTELMPSTSENKAPGKPLNAELLNLARTQLQSSFDEKNGGFGEAPKFPHPTNIERLLRHWRRSKNTDTPDEQALDMVCLSLEKMACGGIYDQLGGGFCRYSVDAHWMIPHFEKMIYDNGPLLSLYSEAWAITGSALFRRIAEETAAWIMRDMQDPKGGYYATLDADSEGEEGKFYVWDTVEVRTLLSEQDYTVFAPYFALDQAPNFEGRWHLHVPHADEQIMTGLAGARTMLLREREKRVWPGRDEKVLGAWNALVIKGMACAGRYLQRSDFIDSAEQALDFIKTNLWRDGRLFAVYKNNEARFPAYLDDYAFLIDAILELLQARWNRNNNALQFAIALADTLLKHFQDQQSGGFYFTADDHERLIQRPKPVHDDALPAGNGIAAQALIRLGHLLGRIDYLDAAEQTLKWAQVFMEQSPIACNALLLALEEYCFPGQVVILRGRAEMMAKWRQECTKDYHPQRLVLAIPDDADALPGLLAARKPLGSDSEAESFAVTAYVCTGEQCSVPLTDLAALQKLLIQQ